MRVASMRATLKSAGLSEPFGETARVIYGLMSIEGAGGFTGMGRIPRVPLKIQSASSSIIH